MRWSIAHQDSAFELQAKVEIYVVGVHEIAS
jgi:hypothetical protein